MAKQPSNPERQQLVAATEQRLAAAAKAVNASAMALAVQGIDKEEFGLVIREALLNNPDIVNADERSLAVAVRKCCRDGIIPDGDRGALVVARNHDVIAMPMVAGLEQMIIQEVGAEVRSGVVHEGDEVLVVEGIDPKIEIVSRGTEIFKQRTGDNCIGAWCWIKFPWEDNPRLVLFSSDDIARARAFSKASDSPAYKNWPHRMARKACVKSAIWQNRAAIRSHGKGANLIRVVEEDNKAEYGETRVEDVFQGDGSVIDGQAVEVTETGEGQQQPTGGGKKSQTRKKETQEQPAQTHEEVQEQRQAEEPAGPTTEAGQPTGDPDDLTQNLPPHIQQEGDPGPEGEDKGFLPLKEDGEQQPSAFDEGSAFEGDDPDTTL